jgi:hypothetical protein
MRFALATLSLIALAVLAAPDADAQCYSARATYATPTYAAPTYNSVYVAEYVAVPVPVYTIGALQLVQPVQAVPVQPVQPVQQQPLQQAPAPSPCDEVKAQLEQLKLQFQEFQNLKKAMPPAPPEPKQISFAPAPHQDVFVQDCANCHDKKYAAAKGKGLVLTNGNALVALTVQQKDRIIDRLRKRQMPPGKVLPADRLAKVYLGLSY